MIKGYFNDMQVKDRMVSRSRTVTESDVVSFAGLSWDSHPLHTDAEFAARGPFGERIAHGMLVLSIATGLAPLDPESILAFYGIDRLRFIKPTRMGDTVHVESEILALEGRNDESGVVVVDMSVRNQDSDLVIAATIRMLVRRQAK